MDIVKAAQAASLLAAEELKGIKDRLYNRETVGVATIPGTSFRLTGNQKIDDGLVRAYTQYVNTYMAARANLMNRFPDMPPEYVDVLMEKFVGKHPAAIRNLNDLQAAVDEAENIQLASYLKRKKEEEMQSALEQAQKLYEIQKGEADRLAQARFEFEKIQAEAAERYRSERLALEKKQLEEELKLRRMQINTELEHQQWLRDFQTKKFESDEAYRQAQLDLQRKEAEYMEKKIKLAEQQAVREGRDRQQAIVSELLSRASASIQSAFSEAYSVLLTNYQNLLRKKAEDELEPQTIESFRNEIDAHLERVLTIKDAAVTVVDANPTLSDEQKDAIKNAIEDQYTFIRDTLYRLLKPLGD